MNSKILLLNKHKGTTSNNQLQKLKKALGQSKAGFSGTLDPLASGVLPIFFDNSTKFGGYCDMHHKRSALNGNSLTAECSIIPVEAITLEND